MRRVLTSDSRERYGLLLAAIIAAFFVQGVASPGRLEQVAVTALLAGTLVLAVWVADAKARVARPAVVVSLAVVAASVVEAASGHVGGTAVKIANMLLICLAPPSIVMGVVRSLRAKGRVTVEAVFGVLCLYILLGMLFAFVYGLIDRVGGGGFFAGDVPATTSRCLYYSFTTLTTVGYGDLTAASNLGHTLSVSEGLVGQIYLVTIVALIVGNLGRGRPAKPPAP